MMYYVIFKIQEIRDKIESSSHAELILKINNTKRRMILMMVLLNIAFGGSLSIYIYFVYVKGIKDFFKP